MHSNLQAIYTRSNSLADISNFLQANCIAETLYSFTGRISEILCNIIVPTYQQIFQYGAWPEVRMIYHTFNIRD